jgi:glycosyltransferase involved in cell wall biosynthesis
MQGNIFHLPHIHGGFSSALAQGEQSLGLQSTIIGEASIYSPSPDIVHSPFNLKSLASWQERYKTFLRTKNNADIIHFNYGASLFDPPLRKHFLLELPFYPKHIRKVMTFQGSDIRISYAPVILESREYERRLGHKLTHQTPDGIIPKNEVIRKRALAEKIDKHMDRLFALNPDLLTGLPPRAEFLPYPYIFQPQALRHRRQKNEPLKIVHMSTNRILKGTGLIEAQLNKLRKSYHVETRVIIKQPHEIAFAALEWADILIDQVCLGWYGAQAVEALSLGKPVLCYLNPHHRKKYLPSGNIGFIDTDHHGIAQALSTFCDDPTLLEKYGQAGRKFITEFHNSQNIARRIYKDWIES